MIVDELYNWKNTTNGSYEQTDDIAIVEPPTSSASIGAVRTASSKKKNAGRQGAKAVKRIEMASNINDLLDPEDATTFRALSARGNFLAQDRADINFATKELCREFAAPANASNVRLKRLARCLIDARRLVYKYVWIDQSTANDLTVSVDTSADFAGCRVTRRSTNGGTMMRGSHCIKHWSTTQPTIALSSGEAELGGLCKRTGIVHMIEYVLIHTRSSDKLTTSTW